MSKSNENNPYLAVLEIGDVVAGTPLTLPGMSIPRSHRVKSAKLIANAAAAGDDTNNVQVELKVGSTVLATHLNDVASGGLAQRVGKYMTLGAEADLLQPKDADMIIDVTHNGTGQALTGAKLQVELYPK